MFEQLNIRLNFIIIYYYQILLKVIDKHHPFQLLNLFDSSHNLWEAENVLVVFHAMRYHRHFLALLGLFKDSVASSQHMEKELLVVLLKQHLIPGTMHQAFFIHYQEQVFQSIFSQVCFVFGSTKVLQLASIAVVKLSKNSLFN